MCMFQQCTTKNSTMVICRFPVIDIPRNFLPYLDSLSYVPLFPPDKFIDKTDSTPSSPCPKYQKPSTAQASSPISFRVGFLLDGVKDFTDMGKINVFPPPNICVNGTVITYRGKNMTVTVRCNRNYCTDIKRNQLNF